MKRLTVFINAASYGGQALTADKRAQGLKQSVASLHQVRRVTVGEAGDGLRLDNFLARSCPGVPKSHLYRLIRSGQVRVNRGRAHADTRLAASDEVRIPPIRTITTIVDKPSVAQQREFARQGAAIAILYEDDQLIIINKPAGVAVHGGSGLSSGVIEQLRAARPDDRFLELVHRLDRETSGVLMVARRRAALVGLHDQIRRGLIGKVYQAITAGRLPRRDQTLRQPLRRYVTADGDRRVVVDEQNGKPAISHIRALETLEHPQAGWLSRVRVRIETGRTHQIRVHLANRNNPVVGDRKYGNFELNRLVAHNGPSRMMLHATELTIRHPSTGEPLNITATPPPEFDQLVPIGNSQQFSQSAAKRPIRS